MSAGVAAATMAALLAPQGGAAAPATGAFTALSGGAAAGYTVPADMRLVRRLAIGGGTYERYQQVYGAAGARGATHHQALRALGNRLVGVLHGCLTHRVAYQEPVAWPAAEAAV
jgi:hypothetical protein